MSDSRESLFRQTMRVTIADKEGLCGVSATDDKWREAFGEALERFVDQAASSLRDAEDRMRDELFDLELLLTYAREGGAYTGVDLSIFGNEIQEIRKRHGGDEYLGLDIDPSQWTAEELETRQRLDKNNQRVAAAIVDDLGEDELRERIKWRHASFTAISCLRRLKNYGLSTNEIRQYLSTTTSPTLHAKTVANLENTEAALVQVLFQHDDKKQLVFSSEWGLTEKKPILKRDWTAPRKPPYTHSKYLYERMAENLGIGPDGVRKNVNEWSKKNVGPFPKGKDNLGSLDEWIRCGEEIVRRKLRKL